MSFLQNTTSEVRGLKFLRQKGPGLWGDLGQAGGGERRQELNKITRNSPDLKWKSPPTERDHLSKKCLQYKELSFKSYKYIHFLKLISGTNCSVKVIQQSFWSLISQRKREHQRGWKDWTNWLFPLLPRQLTRELGRGWGALYRFILNAWWTGRFCPLCFFFSMKTSRLSSAVSFS